MLSGKTILLTGGTGSFGQKFTETVLRKYNPRSIRIFSRDELKQWEMRKKFHEDSRLRFFIGDVRDRERLHRATAGVDIIVHAAALKQVPLCEYNPIEAIKTNIIGAQNIVETAIDRKVERVIAISTDKAVGPVNLYGATKMCMEKLFIAANSYAGEQQIKFSCTRYGNVIGSRGSVVQLFREQASAGRVTVTDERMTRFWLTLEQGVEFVIRCIQEMRGGEVFIPKISSMKIMDLVQAIAPNCQIILSGLRPGEKIHECLLTVDEARHTIEYPDHFIVEPEFHWWTAVDYRDIKNRPQEGFEYSSHKNDRWLTVDDLRKIISYETHSV